MPGHQFRTRWNAKGAAACLWQRKTCLDLTRRQVDLTICSVVFRTEGLGCTRRSALGFLATRRGIFLRGEIGCCRQVGTGSEA